MPVDVRFYFSYDSSYPSTQFGGAVALTRRQYQVLAFLDSFVRERGYCPSYDVVRKSMGLASLATVHKHLNTLERKGFIHRDSNRSRSIEVINRQPMIEVAAVEGEPSRELEKFEVASVDMSGF